MLLVKLYVYMCKNNKYASVFKFYKVNVKTFYQIQRDIAVNNNDIDNFKNGTGTIGYCSPVSTTLIKNCIAKQSGNTLAIMFSNIVASLYF